LSFGGGAANADVPPGTTTATTAVRAAATLWTRITPSFAILATSSAGQCRYVSDVQRNEVDRASPGTSITPDGVARCACGLRPTNRRRLDKAPQRADDWHQESRPVRPWRVEPETPWRQQSRRARRRCTPRVSSIRLRQKRAGREPAPGLEPGTARLQGGCHPDHLAPTGDSGDAAAPTRCLNPPVDTISRHE